MDSIQTKVGFLKIINDKDDLWNKGEHDEDRILKEISKVLVDGEICCVMEIGYYNQDEFKYFVNGSCAAVDTNGKQIFFSTDGLYGRVMMEFGVAIFTLCQD
jgi:hypothetical protein